MVPSCKRPRDLKYIYSYILIYVSVLQLRTCLRDYHLWSLSPDLQNHLLFLWQLGLKVQFPARSLTFKCPLVSFSCCHRLISVGEKGKSQFGFIFWQKPPHTMLNMNTNIYCGCMCWSTLYWANLKLGMCQYCTLHCIFKVTLPACCVVFNFFIKIAF